jgi:hypothetical protein
MTQTSTCRAVSSALPQDCLCSGPGPPDLPVACEKPIKAYRGLLHSLAGPPTVLKSEQSKHSDLHFINFGGGTRV